MIVKQILVLSLLVTCSSLPAASQTGRKPISPELFGIFFEDLSYAADGGLYAELVQNRSFEYTPADRKGWQSFTGWEYITDGFGYGTISIGTSSPVHANNPHYAMLHIEEEGQKGIGLVNHGFDGIVVKAGGQYDFSAFIQQVSDQEVPISVSLQSKKGVIYGEAVFSTDTREWKKYSATITAGQNDDSARLVFLAKGKGRLSLDLISLFPKQTFRQRNNGLRADLAQAIADLKPKFMRFPGGCLVHGDGIGNMYRWKNTIGPVEQRIAQRNIWGYHQTMGLGYFEYFQFCEDIGAKPVPVVAAAVSCQNSGGTWRIGGTGQKGIPLNEMNEYIQEVLDLIEYANGPVTSTWGAKRAAAGHSQPFNLEYIGIGNEDKQTDLFRSRFKMLYDAVKAKYPAITIIGTVGPASSGEDFEQGWSFANQLAVPFVDEHYYEKPEWFLANQFRYDAYKRSGSKIYLGEYASRGNTLFNALTEAVYMTALERNGDVVRMASYAPLIANQNHTSWNPNLIYFNNTSVAPTINYHVQRLFSLNQGDVYCSNVISGNDVAGNRDSVLAFSCVTDSKTNDIILKFANAGAVSKKANVNLSGLGRFNQLAALTVLSGDPASKNTIGQPLLTVPKTAAFTVQKMFSYDVPAWSVSVIRIKSN